jgi:hypothetical protein
MVQRAEWLEREARDLREQAEGMRCQTRESGGVQCTRGTHAQGPHRIKEEDKP